MSLSRPRGHERLSQTDVARVAEKIRVLLSARQKWEKLQAAEADLFRQLPFGSGISVVAALRDALADALEDYNDAVKERFTISFMGSSKMGKSSLVNALVGFRLLHYQNDVDTMGVTFIRYAPEGTRPKLYLANQHGNPLSTTPIAEGEVEVFTKIGELHAQIKQRYDQDEKSAVKEQLDGEFLVIVSPMKLAEGLPVEVRDKFQLVDTPGPDKAGNNRRVSKVAWDQNARAHLTVGLVTPKDSGTTRAQEVFKQYSAVREENGRSLYPHVKDDSAYNPLFVAVTNFDLVDESEKDETLETVREHVSRYLQPKDQVKLSFCKDRLIPCIPREKVWVNQVERGETLEGKDLSQMLKLCFGVNNGKTMADLLTTEGKAKVAVIKPQSNVDTLTLKLQDFIVNKSYPTVIAKHSAIVSVADDKALNLASRVITLCKVLNGAIQLHIGQPKLVGQVIGKQLFADVQVRLKNVATRVEAGNLQFLEEAELFVHLANKYQASVVANNGSFNQITAEEASSIATKLSAVRTAIVDLFGLDDAAIEARMANMRLS